MLIVQRGIVAVLRNLKFTSLDALNLAVAELLEKLNEQPFRKLMGDLRPLFEQLDAPALQPLPARRFELADWKKALVNIDYQSRLKVSSTRTVGALPDGRIVFGASDNILRVWDVDSEMITGAVLGDGAFTCVVAATSNACYG